MTPLPPGPPGENAPRRRGHFFDGVLGNIFSSFVWFGKPKSIQNGAPGPSLEQLFGKWWKLCFWMTLQWFCVVFRVRMCRWATTFFNKNPCCQCVASKCLQNSFFIEIWWKTGAPWTTQNWLKRSVAVLGSIFFVTFSALGAKGYEEALPRLTVNPKSTKKYRKVNKTR